MNCLSIHQYHRVTHLKSCIRIDTCLPLLPLFSSPTTTHMLLFTGCYWVRWRLAKGILLLCNTGSLHFSSGHAVPKTFQRHNLSSGNHVHFSTNILLKFTHFTIWKYWWWAQVQWIIVWIRLHNKYAECSKSFSPPQRKVFFKKWDAFFAFCNVILGISNTSFDNSMKWMNKMWISFGYNGEKYLNEFNFPWKKKTASHFSDDL